jgi:hypothetical protein
MRHGEADRTDAVEWRDREFTMNDPKNNDAPLPQSDDARKAWSAPVIEDADISAITSGTGTSGMEGSAFLKPGS